MYVFLFIIRLSEHKIFMLLVLISKHHLRPIVSSSQFNNGTDPDEHVGCVGDALYRCAIRLRRLRHARERMHITVRAGYLGLCKPVRFLRGLRIWVGHEVIVYNEPPARIDRPRAHERMRIASFKYFTRRQMRNSSSAAQGNRHRHRHVNVHQRELE